MNRSMNSTGGPPFSPRRVLALLLMSGAFALAIGLPYARAAAPPSARPAQATETETATGSATSPTGTQTGIPTGTETEMATGTATMTEMATGTATVTEVATGTTTGTADVTVTATGTIVATGTTTGTVIATGTVTGTVTATGTVTGTIQATATMTGTVMATGTVTGTMATPTRRPLAMELGLPFTTNKYFYGHEDTVSGVQVQNLDDAQPARFTATFHRPDGQVAFTLTKDAAPGGAPNIYLPTHGALDGLAAGLYSIMLRANRPIGAIVRTDWNQSRGSAIYSQLTPGSDLVVPSFRRVAGDGYSVVSIQNMGTEPAMVRAKAHTGLMGARAMIDLGPYTVPAGAAVRIFANLDPALQAAGDFDGWLRVTSMGAAVVAQAYVIGDKPVANPIRPVYGYEGQPIGEAASELLVPLFRSGQNVLGDRGDTSLALVNPGAVPATVTIDYFGTGIVQASPACRNAEFSHPAVTIPPMGSAWIDQRQGGGHNLPSDCFGSAVVRTGGPGQRVLAMVLDRTNTDELLSAYDAVPAGMPGTRVALPLIRRRHVDLTTGIQVMNAGAAPAQVSIAFSATDARTDRSTPITGCTSCVQTIAPRESYTWWPPIIAAIPDNTFGSATVTSDQPIVVLVVDYPMSGQVDPAAYLGLTTR